MIPKSLQIGPKIGPKLVVRVQKGQNYGPKWFQKWRVLAFAGVCLDLGTIKIRKLCSMHKRKENEFGKHFGKMIPKSLQIGPKIGPKLVLKVQNGQKMVQNSPKSGVGRRVHGVCRRVPACAWRVLACARVCRRVHFSTTPVIIKVDTRRVSLKAVHVKYQKCRNKVPKFSSDLIKCLPIVN